MIANTYLKRLEEIKNQIERIQKEALEENSKDSTLAAQVANSMLLAYISSLSKTKRK